MHYIGLYNHINNMDKDKEIKKILDELVEGMGVSVVNLGGEKMQVESQPTGSIALDLALGIGGLPKGRIIELYGPESGGKTTISLLAAAEVQKRGGVVLFLDAENAFSPQWAAKLGVDVDPYKFPIIQNNSAEKVFDLLEKAVDSKKFDMIIVDSVTSLSPNQEIEGSMEDQTIGLQARIISKGLRKIVGKVGSSKTIVIFINQLREKVGIMFGNPETTPGGRALKFYASVRMRVSKSGKEILDDAKNKTGHEINVRIEKNKVAPPYREAILTLLYDRGIDRIGEVFNVATSKGIITRSGPTYTFGNKSWRGQEAVKAEIRSNSAFAEELMNAIKQAPSDLAVGTVSEDEPLVEE